MLHIHENYISSSFGEIWVFMFRYYLNMSRLAMSFLFAHDVMMIT